MGTLKGSELIVDTVLVFAGLLFTAARIPRNRFVGMRLPVFCRTDRAWREGHRIAGPIWVLGGGVGFAERAGGWSSAAMSVTLGVTLVVSVGLAELWVRWAATRVVSRFEAAMDNDPNDRGSRAA